MGVLVRGVNAYLCRVLANKTNIFLAGVRNQLLFLAGTQPRTARHCSILPMAAVTVHNTRGISTPHPSPAAPRAKRLLRPADFWASDSYAFPALAAHLVDSCGHIKIAIGLSAVMLYSLRFAFAMALRKEDLLAQARNSAEQYVTEHHISRLEFE